MGYNSKEIKVSEPAKKPSKPKDVDYISKMGYRDDSPFRDRASIDIHTPNGIIDMSNTGIPLMANGAFLPPYSGQHQFNTNIVTESRMSDDEEMRYGGLKKKRTTHNPAVGINDLMLRNQYYHTAKGKHFVPFKKQGGTMNKDDSFYVLHEDAARLRASTPINFLNSPYYKEGGGLSREEDFGSEKKPYPSVSKGDFAGGGRSYPIPTKADAIDALRLAALHGRDDVRRKVFAKYPELKRDFGGVVNPEDYYYGQGGEDEYGYGGASNGPLGYFGDGGRKKKDIEVNPNYATDSMATVNYAQQHPELYDFNKMKWSTNPAGDVLYKQPITAGKEGRKNIVPFGKGSKMTAEDEKAIKWHINEREINNSGQTQFPYLFGAPPVQKLGGDNSNEKLYYMEQGGMPCMDCGGTHMDVGGTPTNYGAFPVMMGGGEFNMIINDLLKKQFGGNGAEEQSPSIDNVLESKRNFFNNYIRGNVSKSFADEMQNEMQQMMMGQSYRQQGGSFNDVDTNTVTGNNENLSMQMRFGGLPKAQDGTGVDAFYANQHPGVYGTGQQSKCTSEQMADPNSSCYDPNYANSQYQSNPDKTLERNRYFQNKVDTDLQGQGPYKQQWDPSVTPGSGNTTRLTNPFGYSDDTTQNNTDELQTFPMITNQDLQNRNEMQVRTNQENQMNDRFMQQPKKNYWWNGVDVANSTIAQMQGLSNLLESSQNAKQEEANKWRTSGDAIFAAKPKGSSSRGDYDINSGDFRKDQYVPVQYPGYNMGNAGTNEYAQMGGGFKENDDVYMSDEEIQQYLAAGGQVEFLD